MAKTAARSCLSRIQVHSSHKLAEQKSRPLQAGLTPQINLKRRGPLFFILVPPTAGISGSSRIYAQFGQDDPDKYNPCHHNAEKDQNSFHYT
jgi:hypothetical protein